MWRIVRRVAERAHLKTKVFPHSLRATFATKLSYLGLSSAAIQHIMGWAKLTTAEKYVQSSGARAVEEMRRKWKV